MLLLAIIVLKKLSRFTGRVGAITGSNILLLFTVFLYLQQLYCVSCIILYIPSCVYFVCMWTRHMHQSRPC